MLQFEDPWVTSAVTVTFLECIWEMGHYLSWGRRADIIAVPWLLA